MTRIERIEIVLMSLAVIAGYFFTFGMVAKISLSTAVAYLAVTAFIQSLVRDLYLLSRITEHAHETQEKRCFCVESLFGVSILFAGLLLLIVGNTTLILLNQTTLTFSLASVLVIGFFIKDLVVTWRPFGITREKNHSNIIVKW